MQAVVGAAPVLAWFAAFPAVIRGPDGLLTPVEARAFLGVISEFRPLHGWEPVQFLLPGMLAAATAAMLACRTRGLGWIAVVLCALAAVALGARHVRFATYSVLLGAMALPVALTWCGLVPALRGRPLRALTPPRDRFAMVLARRQAAVLTLLARPAVLLSFLAGPLIGAVVPLAPEAEAASATACQRPPSAALLAAAAGQVVLARPDETPDLLYRTSVLTVGSLYHRGIAAYMRDRAAWREPPGAVEPAAVRETEARWVLLCRSSRRSPLVADLTSDTLEDRLRAGTIPPWLQPAGVDAAGWMLWRVMEVRFEHAQDAEPAHAG